ncbi:MAG: CARDB domain-containing protein [Candidatus Beckwithbacteria bacterium]
MQKWYSGPEGAFMRAVLSILIVLFSIFVPESVSAVTLLRTVASPTPTPEPEPVRTITVTSPSPTPESRIITIQATPTPTPTPLFITPRSTPTPTPARFTFTQSSTDSAQTVGKLIILNVSSSTSSSFIPITLERKKDTAELKFDVLGSERRVSVMADFIIENGRFFLIGKNNERQTLKMSPPSFYAAALAALKNVGTLRGLELSLEGSSPFYILDTTQRVKLFGFIPISARVKLKVDARTNMLDTVNKSLLSKLAQVPDFDNLLSQGPNLEFKNVRFEPLSYQAGEKIVIRADLYNSGTQTAYGLVGSHVKNWLFHKDQQVYGDNEQVVDIAPGESQTMTYVWNSVLCSAPISIIFDSDRVLDEITPSTVWYGTTTCAPIHGPDLTVTQINFEGLSYGGKNPGVSNKVNYIVKNIGDANSEPVKALAKAGNGQYLSLISVPFLAPNGYYSGTFNYTPVTCDPVDINIDTQGLMASTETNRDNNDIFEDPQITQWCNNLPQLQFDRVYWKVNGYSFGKSAYPNGSFMDFEVDVGNLSWEATVGCAALVKIRVEVNGQFYTDIPVGTVGNCANGGWHSVGDNAHMAKTVKFKIGPACNADVTMTLDPDHINQELDRTNNVWSTKIQCE